MIVTVWIMYFFYEQNENVRLNFILDRSFNYEREYSKEFYEVFVIWSNITFYTLYN